MRDAEMLNLMHEAIAEEGKRVARECAEIAATAVDVLGYDASASGVADYIRREIRRKSELDNFGPETPTKTTT